MTNPPRNWRGVIGVPALLAVLTALFMIAALRSPTGIETLDGHDLVNQQYPLLSLIFDSVRDGHGLPLWNPYLFAGQSIVANPQSTFFYPPAWLMLPLGVPRATTWLVALHVWLGGWGIACFTRRLGASWPGALCGAITYAFSALIGARIGAGHLNYLLCQAWLPWIATAYLWSLTRSSLLAILPGAALFGVCILTGYPPLLYFAGLWLLILWIYTVAQAQAERRQIARRSLIRLIGIGGIGALLGAALLLPTLQLTLRSTRTQQASLTFSNSFALPGGQLITLLFPNVFGYPTLPDQGYWGLPFYEESTAYVGILPLFAICFVRRRPTATLFSVCLLIGLLVSIGIDGGLFPALYWLLPGYSLFRVPSRALYFFVVGAAGLIALTVTDLEDANIEERLRLLRVTVYRLLPVLGLFALIASFALMMVFTTHSADPAPPWRTLVSGNQVGVAVLAIGAAWLLLRLWQSAHSLAARRSLLALTVLIVLLDAWHIAWPMVTVSAIDVSGKWKQLAQIAPASPDFRVMTVPDQIVWQAGATYTRHLNASGYDPLVGSDYQQFWQAAQDNPLSPIARLLGVRYVYSNGTLPGSDRLTLRDHQGDGAIYEVRDPLPRVFIVPNSVTLDAKQALIQLTSGAVDPLKTAFVDLPATCAQNDPAAPTGTAHIVRYEPNTVEIETDSAAGGLLVLTDSYDPDWLAFVNDAPAPVLRIDTTLRGVCVAGGTQRVRFVYQPRAFFVGLGISVASWLAIAMFGLIGIRRVRSTLRALSLRLNRV